MIESRIIGGGKQESSAAKPHTAKQMSLPDTTMGSEQDVPFLIHTTRHFTGLLVQCQLIVSDASWPLHLAARNKAHYLHIWVLGIVALKGTPTWRTKV